MEKILYNSICRVATATEQFVDIIAQSMTDIIAQSMTDIIPIPNLKG